MDTVNVTFSHLPFLLPYSSPLPLEANFVPLDLDMEFLSSFYFLLFKILHYKKFFRPIHVTPPENE
jgi:hypothetical protein